MRAFCFVVVGWLVSTVAGAVDLDSHIGSESESESEKRVLFVDHGVLTSVSEFGIVRMDTETGDILVTPAKTVGAEEIGYSPTFKLNTPMALDRFLWLDAGPQGNQKSVGDCSFKAETLSLQASVVARVCPGGEICRQARNSLLLLWADFWLCANNVPEP